MIPEQKFKTLNNVGLSILQHSAFTEGIMDTSFYDSMNQKILSAAMKYTFVLQCFWGNKISDKSGYE